MSDRPPPAGAPFPPFPPPPPGSPPVDPSGVLRPPGVSRTSPSQVPPVGGVGLPPNFPPPPPGPGGYGWPPPKRPRSVWRPVLLTLLGLGLFVGVVFVGLIVVGGIVGASSGGGGGGGQVVRTTVQPGARDQTVAVIPVRGLIVDETETRFRRQLAAVARDANVKGVVISVSSPGGTVSDSNQIYHALLAFKRDHDGLPVYFHFDDVAASGGYYIACAGDRIYAEETTVTGSIGVLIQYPQLDEFAEKTGLRLRTIVADGSPRKGFLDTFSPPNEQDLRDVRALLNEQYALFRGVVEAGRLEAITAAGATLDEVANGEVFVGRQALDRGLVDEIGFLQDAIDGVATFAGLTNPRVVRFDRPPTVLESLGFARGPSVRADAESLRSLAVQLLHEATTPRVLYLYGGAW